MEHGICLYMVIAVRKESAHQSEMVTQLLFGETYTVLETTTEWCKICTDDCHYEGWISQKQHSALTDDDFKQYWAELHYFVNEPLLYVTDLESTIDFPIFIGSQFPMPESNRFDIASHHYHVKLPESSSKTINEELTEQQNSMLTFANHYLNAPYLWGGRTPAGIDCSGFVQLIGKSVGIDLPRDASQQVLIGTNVDFVEEAQVGDLAFFENEEGNIVHTGMVYGNHRIIHASGHVQVNILDENGIFNQYLQKYTHKLCVIKRILP